MNKNPLLSLSLAAVAALVLLPIGVAVSASVIAAAGILAIAFGEYRTVRVPLREPVRVAEPGRVSVLALAA